MIRTKVVILFLATGCGALFGQHYAGSLDTVTCGGLSGWAWDGTDNPINVDLYDGSVYVTSASASQYQAGLPGNGYHDFTLATPSTLKDNQVHNIYARFGGTIANLSNTPRTIQCNSSSSGYTYYYTDSFSTINTANWALNGAMTVVNGWGLTATSAGGGSLISSIPVQPSPQNPNLANYEVSTTLALNQSGGTYVQYLRASPDALSNGSGEGSQGTYVAVELQKPTFTSSGCSATLAVYQRVSGTVYQLLSNNMVGCRNGMQIRTAIFGTSANILVNGSLYFVSGISVAGPGAPGVGGRSIPSNQPNAISVAALGSWDNLAPSPVNSNSFTTSVYFNGVPGAAGNVTAGWQGAVDDSNGVGVAYYSIYRTTISGTDYTTKTILSYDASFWDGSVLAQNTYNYAIVPYDFHGNAGPEQDFPVSTGQGTVDGHRIGVRPTGSYWGGAGEQIDLLSGNVNYTLPLITAVGRGGLKTAFALSYNSQNWRVVSFLNVPRVLGADTGYGFGWQLMLGSLMPVYGGNGALVFYLYTDATGAQYHLSQQNNGVWSSTESVYVWYDSRANRLYFRNGTFWVMGCTSAGGEQDGGSLYPTVVEDSNGNQIIIRYLPGASTNWNNSSSRISEIEDARAVPYQDASGDTVYRSYSFGYLAGANGLQYLQSITSYVSTLESYTVAINQGQALNAPPPSGASFAYTGLLQSVTANGVGFSWNFTYDTATNDGELTQVQFPQGGYLQWDYSNFMYAGQRTLREVADRYLVSNPQSGQSTHYTFSRPDASNSVALHTAITLDDLGSNTEKYWAFMPPAQRLLLWPARSRAARACPEPPPRWSTITTRGCKIPRGTVISAQSSPPSMKASHTGEAPRPCRRRMPTGICSPASFMTTVT